MSTALRHPASPGLEWGYWPRYSLPPTGELEGAEVRRFGAGKAPVPGLRTVAFADGTPLAYLVDTRGMSLEARGSQSPKGPQLDVPEECREIPRREPEPRRHRWLKRR